MKKFLKVSLVVFLIGSFLCLPVMAKGHDGFHADSDFSLEKKINSTLFAAGNNVDVSSEVDGASFIAGNNLTLKSKQDFLFAAGNTLQLKEVEAKDAFLAGSKIEITDSYIRDLYAAAEIIRIDSDIDRNAYLGGSKVTINGLIDGDCYVSAEEIRIGKNAHITGTLKYPEKSDISISESAVINKTKTYKTKEVDIKVGIKEIIIGKVISYFMILLIGLVFLALGKKAFKKIEKMDFGAGSIVKNLIIGFLALIAIPISSIIIMITIIGIPLGIILLILYGITIYLSIIATSYYLGSHLFKNKIKNSYLLLTISLLILYIVEMIPIIGGFVSLASLCIGLSVYLQLVKSLSK